MLRNRCNVRKRANTNNDNDDFSSSRGLSVQSTPSVFSKFRTELSPRRRKLRKERLALEEAAAMKECEAERLRAKPLSKGDIARYEQLQVKKQDIYLQNQRVKENTYANLDHNHPKAYLYESSSFYIGDRSDSISNLVGMKAKINRLLHIIMYLSLMFLAYDKNVTDVLMHFDDNMFPVIILIHLAMFVNIFTLIGLYVIDAIENNDQMTVFQSTVVFVRRNLILLSVLIYIVCWLICGVPRFFSLLVKSMIEGSSKTGVDGILSRIDWFQLQCESLYQMKTILKYISSFSISCVLCVEGVAHHMKYIHEAK